ncbi:MAG: class I SAM-dependent methyltransferase [Chitinophagaceae bacterium]|jgi:SAM-dependent methyltransferase
MKLKKTSVPENITCPVCQNECKNSVLSTYTIEETASYFCPPTRNKDRYERLLSIIFKLWKRQQSYLVECDVCTFKFGYPHVGGDEAFYGILHEQYGYPTWRVDYDIAIEKVIKNFDSGKILDIGAGSGNFLKSLSKNWNLQALEGSDTTRKILAEKNINAASSFQELLSDGQNTFDLITMFQVLEHISDFYMTLENCHKLLKKGGKIFISVPDGVDMVLQEEILLSPDYPPNHINKWTVPSIKFALEKTGFSEIHFLKTPNSLNELKSAIHVKMLSDASKKNKSLAGLIYRIQSKKIRIPFLLFLSIITIIKLLPNIYKLYRGRTLIVYANA